MGEIKNVFELYVVLLLLLEDIAICIMYDWDPFCTMWKFICLEEGIGGYSATQNSQKAAAVTSMKFAFCLCPQRSKAFSTSFILQFVRR